MRKRFCLRGHDTSIVGRRPSGNCILCTRIDAKEWAASHRERVLTNVRRWVQTNRERVNLRTRQYNSTHREQDRNSCRKWQLTYPARDRASLRKNELKRLQRVPNWGQEGIPEFYTNCPDGMVVDHFYPLLGKLCSGLHVLWNLRYLTPQANLKKGNRMPEEELTRV